MPALIHRQSQILDYVRRHADCQTGDILAYFRKTGAEDVSRVTIIRDLNLLLKKKLIKKAGRGPSVRYSENVISPLFAYFNSEDYFKKQADDRVGVKKNFDFNVFKNLNGLFTAKELSSLDKVNADFLRHIKKLPAPAIKKEWERLTIELSWKSSQIEGNTYSLIDTEILIKEHQEAKGHKKDEAIMILNHKKALDWIFKNPRNFTKLSLSQIENLHRLLVDKLGVETGIRKGLVGIVGTNFRPLDNSHQIREALEKTVRAVNSSKHPLEKVLIASLLIAYIQPFYDGNKRTSRILANAILMAHNYCPLSFRSINESQYKKAVILFYEQNSLLEYKELFMEQFKFAVRNYFLT